MTSVCGQLTRFRRTASTRSLRGVSIADNTDPRKPLTRSLAVVCTAVDSNRRKPSTRSRSLSRISSLRSDSACSDDSAHSVRRDRVSPFQSARKLAPLTGTAAPNHTPPQPIRSIASLPHSSLAHLSSRDEARDSARQVEDTTGRNSQNGLTRRTRGGRPDRRCDRCRGGTRARGGASGRRRSRARRGRRRRCVSSRWGWPRT